MSLRFSRLGRLAIRKLLPGEKIIEHGITAERLAEGDTRYSVNVMVDGQRIHRVIGKESDGVTRSQAEEFIERARSDARAGRLLLPRGRKVVPTFARLAPDYITRLEAGDGKGIDVKRRHLRRTLLPFFGRMRLEEINPFAVARYTRERLKAGVKPGTINREISTLGHLLNRAFEWGLMDKAPPRLRRLEEPEGRNIVLTEEQIEGLLRAALDVDPDLWLFIQIALGSSMRHREILHMKWSEIDFDHRRLFIPRAKRGARTQPLTASLTALLEHERAMRVDREGWVFPARHKRVTNAGHMWEMRRPFQAAARLAGLDPKTVTPHTLRHTVVTRLVQSGADLATVQAVSGHKSLKMVLRYTHVSAPHVDKALAAIDRDTTTPGLHQPGAGRRRADPDQSAISRYTRAAVPL